MADVFEKYVTPRPEVNPTIYAYKLNGVTTHDGYIKVGYTDRDVKQRIKEQLHTSAISYTVLCEESAMRPDGSCFNDRDVHAVLKRNGFHRLNENTDKNEWYNCTVNDVRSAVRELRTGERTDEYRTADFKMRPEQSKAVDRTIEYFENIKKTEPERIPKFLWNAKMRFGKTFAAYELCKKMNFKRILILTFKPAVESAWSDDLRTHVDFEGWQYVSNKDAHNNKQNIDEAYYNADSTRPIVVFGSFQDLLGTNENGGIKYKNEFIHTTNWDIVIFDEYHFGAWRENAKKLFDDPDDEDIDFDAEKYQKEEAGNAVNETFLPITSSHYLYLSGTPFRAMHSGEFIEEQIFNWTYSDEQSAKENWKGKNNPYLSLPRMVMMTYKIPESIRSVASEGEFDGFDLNLFFSAKGKGEDARFVNENEVQKWLDLIRGAYLPASVDDLKIAVSLGVDKRPPMPFSDTRLLNVLSHTLWFLPSVASCFAMYNLLMQSQNNYYNQGYKINVCAGIKAGVGLDAVKPVIDSMGDPLVTRTITLTCGKLTTGVTVKPWTGIFMLRNLKSPETYFQSAFRVQSPWTVKNEKGEVEIIKHECYVFDFALDRALRQISDYACNLNSENTNPEKNVSEFINFLPVLAYDGSTMEQVNAQAILDITLAGTSATLLAKRWQSALLVNVDNDTLKRLMASTEAMTALENIEAFRNLNKELEVIINKSEAVKKLKKDGVEKLTPKEKKELTEAEKEFKSKRKEVQEKLMKFASRIPVFMYLTDYRESCLKDVITQLEPGLFKKVTGLDTKDFDLLCSLGVFNSSLMNHSIFQFKRYEDASLTYTGIDMHRNDKEIGGWDTAIRKDEYKKLFYNQQESMNAPQPTEATEDIAELKKEVTRSSAVKSVKPSGKSTAASPTTPPLVTEKFGIKSPVPKAALPVPDRKRSNTPDFDESSITVGMTVIHKKFGEGKVQSIADKHIYVKFADGQKNFTFPAAFTGGFLHLPK